MQVLAVLMAFLMAVPCFANGPVPEKSPALEYIKAEAKIVRHAGFAIMICGGALALGGGALLAGNDGGDEIVAGASIMASGLMVGAGGYLVVRAHDALVGWLP